MFSYIKGRHGGCQHTAQGASMCLYAPYPLYICLFPLYHMFPICQGDLGPSVHPICLGVFWGPSRHLSGISVSISTSIASQFITFIPVAVHHCGLLLYWNGCLWMSDMLHAVVPFFVVFSLCLKLLLPWL